MATSLSDPRGESQAASWRLFRSHRLETTTEDLSIRTFRMRDKKRLDCRFFRLVAAERAQRADPSELGFLRQHTFCARSR